ncbi:MAG TPA: helix-turn-helix domain-containing protein [Capsulimonadaceae bacterium]|jgi:AraC-like DNA-binding protein
MKSKLVNDDEVARFIQNGSFTFEGSFRTDLAVEYCEFHSHPFFEIVMHSENRGRVMLQSGEPVAFEPGSFVVHPPNIPHGQYTDEPGYDLCILVGSSLPAPPRLRSLLYVSGGRHPWLPADVMALMGASRKESSLMSRAYDHRAAALLMQLLDAVDDLDTSPGLSPGAALAQEAERVILRDYGTLAGVGALAEQLCVSASYLRHVYQRYHGAGVKQRLIRVRLDRACDLLVGSTLPIKTISAVCGFDNDRYFSSTFRAAIGTTPGEYRRQWSPG